MPATLPRALLLLETPTRPRYFDGRMLTARDLQDEQAYHIAARRRIALIAVGPGVVTGLRVSVESDRGCVVVSRGMAIDGLGREIIVPEAVELPLASLPQPAPNYVVLSYAEDLADPTPVMDDDGDSAGVQHATVRETYRLSLSSTKPPDADPGAGIVIGTVPAPRQRATSPRPTKRASPKRKKR